MKKFITIALLSLALVGSVGCGPTEQERRDAQRE